MRILSVDAATKGLGVAIAEEGRLLAFAALNVGKTHSQRLLPLLDDLLKEAAIGLDMIDLIAVTVGPGSFTGLRIGISTAKALAVALGLKLVPVRTLDALAYNGRGCGKLICPILDARRNEVYYGVYDEHGTALSEPGALAPQALAEQLAEQYPDRQLLFLGDGADAYFPTMQAVLNERACLISPERRIFMADSAAFWALEHADQAVPAAAGKAFYLRQSEAEVKRKAAQQNG